MPAAPTLWTLREELCLMDHVEANKGPEGLYCTRPKKAVELAKNVLDREVPGNDKNVARIEGKLGKLRQRHCVREGHLFYSGWNALKPGRWSRSKILSLAEEEAKDGEKQQDGVLRVRKAKSANIAEPHGENRQLAEPLGVPGRMSSTPESSDSVLDGISSPSLSHGRASHPIVLVPNVPQGQESSQNPPAVTDSQQRRQLKIELDHTEDEGRHLETIRCYLNDPTKFLPSVSVLGSLIEELIREIHEAARDLLDDTYTPPQKRSHLGVFLSVKSSPPFSNLCCSMYGVVSEEELLQVLSGPSLVSQLDLEPFLRVAVAAAIYEWVLQGQHSPLPRDLFETAGIASVYCEVASKAMPDLHEQLFRQSKQLLVDERIKLEPYASRLAFRLIDTLTPFLRTNLVTPDEKSMVKWNQCLIPIFEKALRLTLQASLLDIGVAYQWPTFRAKFDPRTMRSAELSATKGDGVVQTVFFPSVHPIGLPGRQNIDITRPVSRAVVQLQ